MNRRQFLKLAGASLGAAFISHLPPSIRNAGNWLDLPANRPLAGLPGQRPPNVVLILADDMGYADPGYLGSDLPTPNIDQLAAESVRASQAYVTCPVCAPSRGGLLTGCYQQRFGLLDNPRNSWKTNPNYGVPPGVPVIAEHLKPAGYVTGAIGKWHVGYSEGRRPTERGFDEFFGFLGADHPYFSAQKKKAAPILRGLEPVDEQDYLTTAFGREANDFIDRHKDEPFFLYFAPNAVHIPLEAPNDYLARFNAIKDTRRRAHAAMLAALDDVVGGILNRLHQHQLEQDTLVIFLSDNGGPTQTNTASNLPFRGGKDTMFEGGNRTPLTLRWPGKLSAGSVFDRPCSSLDFLPTILGAVGAPPLPGSVLDGVDLLPYLTGAAADAPHEQLFWGRKSDWAVRSGDWKLMKARGRKKTMLFDLAADPAEATDLGPKNRTKAKELQDLYNNWLRQL